MPYNPDGSQTDYTRQTVTPEQMREYRRQELIKEGLKNRQSIGPIQSPHPKLRQARENQIRELLAANAPQHQIDRAGVNFRKDFGDTAFKNAERRFNTDRKDAVASQEAQQQQYDKEMQQREEQHYYDNEFANRLRQRYGR